MFKQLTTNLKDSTPNLHLSKKFLAVLILATIIAAMLSYGEAIFFHFVFDDWGYVWAIKYDLARYLTSWVYHPGSFITFFPWFYLFGTNPYFYNLFGVLLKAAAAISFGLVLYNLYRKKYILFLSSILYASYFGGLESYTFVTARISAFLVIGVNLTIFFYIRSFATKSKQDFIISLVLLFLSVASDPVRMLPLIILLILWEFYERKNIKKILKKEYLRRIFLLILIAFLGILMTSYGRSFLIPKSTNQQELIFEAFRNKEYINNFFNSLGYLANSFFSKTPGFDGNIAKVLRHPSNLGLLLLLTLTLGSLIAYLKKWRNGAFLILSSVGVLLMYLPNWIAFPYLTPFANHRYHTFSSMFLLYFIFYYLEKPHKKFTYLMVFFLVIVNVYKSYQINSTEKPYRNFRTVEAIYKEQEKEAPVDTTNTIFVYRGDHPLANLQMGWAAGGTIPLSLMRGVKDVNKLPAFTPDLELASQWVCNSNVKRLVVYDWFYFPKPVPIGSVYSWYIDSGGKLSNDTDQTRIKIAQLAPCLKKEEDISFSDDISLKSTVYLRDSSDSKSSVVGLRWEVKNKVDSNLNIEVSLYDKSQKLLKKQLFETSNNQLQKGEGDILLFLNPKIQGSEIFARINVISCIKPCTNREFKNVSIVLRDKSEDINFE